MVHLLASRRIVVRLWTKCIDVTESHRLQHGVYIYIVMDARSCIAIDAHLTFKPPKLFHYLGIGASQPHATYLRHGCLIHISMKYLVAVVLSQSFFC